MKRRLHPISLLVLVIVIACIYYCRGQQMRFSWTPGTNHLVNSTFTLEHGSASGQYGFKPFTSPSNSIVLNNGWLQPSTNYFAVKQISTNAAGTASITPVSGEVWVLRTRLDFVDAPILTSTNLGGQWSQAYDLQTLPFPTLDQQRFYVIGKMKILETNLMNFGPPATN